jgi:cell division protein FtsQ
VRAGIYVSRRRWTLKMDNGVEIELPEVDPAGAIARLATLEHDGHILEKDILSLDIRMPDRVVARLTEDAAAARAVALAGKKKKGAAT